MAKHGKNAKRRVFAAQAAIERNLSEDALYFIRQHPGARDNLLCMQALEYMDGCMPEATDESR